MKIKGFTLIELLIATAIFSIVTGGGIASYNQFNQREKLKAAALEVKTYLRKAQTNAMAGVKDDSPAGCAGQPLDGWCVDLFRGYTYGHCGGLASPATVDFSVEEFSLPDGINLTFHNPADGSLDMQRSILLFKPLAKGVDQESIICLSSTAFGVNYQYKISITVSGEITDHGFVSCP